MNTAHLNTGRISSGNILRNIYVYKKKEFISHQCFIRDLYTLAFWVWEWRAFLALSEFENLWLPTKLYSPFRIIIYDRILEKAYLTFLFRFTSWPHRRTNNSKISLPDWEIPVGFTAFVGLHKMDALTEIETAWMKYYVIVYIFYCFVVLSTKFHILSPNLQVGSEFWN